MGVQLHFCYQEGFLVGGPPGVYGGQVIVQEAGQEEEVSRLAPPVLLSALTPLLPSDEQVAGEGMSSASGEQEQEQEGA